MTIEVQKEFRFEAAHRLPYVAEGHKCGRLHGHSFVIEVSVSGSMDEGMGWVLDFADISQAAKPVINRLDHHYLNDLPGLANPTSEVLARWFWNEIQSQIPGLSRVTVRETCTSAVSYDGRLV